MKDWKVEGVGREVIAKLLYCFIVGGCDIAIVDLFFCKKNPEAPAPINRRVTYLNVCRLKGR